MRLLFYIGALGTGGAEYQISQIADGLAQRGHQVIMVTLYPGGQNWRWLRQQETTKLLSLYKEKGKSTFIIIWQLFLAAFRLRKIITQEKITRVYSVLYLSNVIAWIAVLGLCNIYLIIGIRASNLKLNWKRSIPFHICKYISFSVPLLISNSYAGLKYHISKGFKPQSCAVIPNGIDLKRFNFNKRGRIHLRKEWRVSEDMNLIGMIGRLDPIKDHPTFIRAAAKITKERNDVMFLCVGDGALRYKSKLQILCRELGLSEIFIWAGERTDMPEVYSSLDISVSSSHGEGFSNCIGEAMACRVPCVVTDVGDSSRIVDDCGIVIPPNNPAMLAESLLHLLELDVCQRMEMGIKSVARIERHFSVSSMVMATEKSLMQLSDKWNSYNVQRHDF